jgi:hypothetical protein
MGAIETSKENGITLFTGKQLLKNEIWKTCTKTSGQSAVMIAAKFEHMHILDAQKVFEELEEAGDIVRRNGLIFKA